MRLVAIHQVMVVLLEMQAQAFGGSEPNNSAHETLVVKKIHLVPINGHLGRRSSILRMGLTN